MTKNWEMTEILAHGYSSDSTQQEISYEYPHDLIMMTFINLWHSCALDKSNLSIRRVNNSSEIFSNIILIIHIHCKLSGHVCTPDVKVLTH